MDKDEPPASSPFAPRASLVRTPPSGFAPPDVPRDLFTPPVVPSRPPRLRNTPPTGDSPATPAVAGPAGLKRPLTSPEERRPIDVVRLCRPVTPAPSETLPRPDTPEPASDTDSDDDAPPNLAKATKLQLLDRVHNDLEGIMSVVTGSASRLNKESTNTIGAKVQDTLAVVAALSLRLCETEAELGRAKVRCAELEKEALLSRTEARPQIQTAVPSYSTALKLSKKADPVRIPAQSGPVLAFYPAQDQTDKLKTAEDTKAELKRAVNPREIDLQVDKLRKVGNAGVLVQTTSQLAASRLRSAAPASLRVAEPRKLSPRISLRDVDGNPSVEDITLALHDQNLRGTEWTLEKLRAQCRIYKMNGRQHNTSTVILECPPDLRELLLSKGRIYIGWNAIEACDFLRVTCCNKCQTFGHPEKYCKAPEVICGKCGGTGHRKDVCKEEQARCATCHRFGRESASHTTNARTCPARLYAEQRAVSTTNYGCP